MTYYELIKNLKILEKEKRNENSYNSFINSNIVLYTNMNYRLGMHLIKFIKNKINIAYKEFIDKLTKNKITEEDFTTGVIDLKNELIYIQSFTNIKYLKSECNDDLKKIYSDLTDDYNNMLLSTIKDIFGETYVNNYNEILKRIEVK